MRLSMRVSAALAFVSLCVVPPLQAQFDSGQISGFVRDSSQLAMPRVNVVAATNEGNGPAASSRSSP